jgi:hypothetical protein
MGSSRGGKGRAVDSALSRAADLYAPFPTSAGTQAGAAMVDEQQRHHHQLLLASTSSSSSAVVNYSRPVSPANSDLSTSSRPLPFATQSALSHAAARSGPRYTHFNVPGPSPGSLLRAQGREWRCVYVSAFARDKASLEPKWGPWVARAHDLCEDRLKRAVLVCLWDGEDGALLGTAVCSLAQLLRTDRDREGKNRENKGNPLLKLNKGPIRDDSGDVSITVKDEKGRSVGSVEFGNVQLCCPVVCVEE